MKFLLDNNLAPRLADLLRAPGHDAEHVVLLLSGPGSGVRPGLSEGNIFAGDFLAPQMYFRDHGRTA